MVLVFSLPRNSYFIGVVLPPPSPPTARTLDIKLKSEARAARAIDKAAVAAAADVERQRGADEDPVNDPAEAATATKTKASKPGKGKKKGKKKRKLEEEVAATANGSLDQVTMVVLFYFLLVGGFFRWLVGSVAVVVMDHWSREIDIDLVGRVVSVAWRRGAGWTVGAVPRAFAKSILKRCADIGVAAW